MDREYQDLFIQNYKNRITFGETVIREIKIQCIEFTNSNIIVKYSRESMPWYTFSIEIPKDNRKIIIE